MIDPNNGTLYESLDVAHKAGVVDPVEMRGTPDAIQRISSAVRTQHKTKRKAQKKARKANR